jgi:hypothetical protein
VIVVTPYSASARRLDRHKNRVDFRKDTRVFEPENSAVLFLIVHNRCYYQTIYPGKFWYFVIPKRWFAGSDKRLRTHPDRANKWTVHPENPIGIEIIELIGVGFSGHGRNVAVYTRPGGVFSPEKSSGTNCAINRK